MRRTFALPIALVISGLSIPAASAANVLTYSFDHHVFTILPAQQAKWFSPRLEWKYLGAPAEPIFCADICDETDVVPPGWTSETVNGANREAIAATIKARIADKLDRAPGAVTISRGSGAVAFSGHGLTGRAVDISWTVDLTLRAIEKHITDIVVPVAETQPQITVADPELTAMGIRDVVTIGESNFAGSPANRRHNIAVGLSKFNGAIIPQGATFSFNEVLGPVNAVTGYRKELVIQGERTLPDYGGGLCQVSSTAYRGIWEYGFPIAQRRNHSYTVAYYAPSGTDATIYPPNIDLKFVNDSPGALLVQTFTDAGDNAYFVYYGTRDRRVSEVFGPYVWSTTPAPEDKRIEYTADIPVGTERKVGSKVPGQRTSWFRSVAMPGAEPVLSETYSAYEARPLFYQVGATLEEIARLTASDFTGEPSWLPTIE